MTQKFPFSSVSILTLAVQLALVSPLFAPHEGTTDMEKHVGSTPHPAPPTPEPSPVLPFPVRLLSPAERAQTPMGLATPGAGPAKQVPGIAAIPIDLSAGAAGAAAPPFRPFLRVLPQHHGVGEGVTLEADGVRIAPLKKNQGKPIDRLLIDLPSPLAPLLFDHKHLVIPHQRFMREVFIETQVNPPFYAICYKGTPVAYLLETVHTLPFAALPPHVVRIIQAIIQTPGSFLIEEITETTFKLDAFFKDPRAKLSPAMREKYPKGWVSLLSRETRDKLSARFQKEKLSHINLNELDPNFILRKLKAVYTDCALAKECRYPLDEAINDIFEAYQRQRLPLEDAERRGEAASEQIFDEMKEAPPMDDKGLELFFNAQASALDDAVADLELAEEMPFYRPTLDHLDFSDPYAMHYLQGAYTADIEDVSVAVRNSQWWRNTILPLLLQRATAKDRHLFPPCLLIYGQAHDQNSYSILDKIVKLRGFKLRLLTRQGWEKWSPKMQVVVELYDRPLDHPNYGSLLPDDLICDAYGRFPDQLHYKNPKPDAKLPDKYGRHPGSFNYGNLLPNNQLQDVRGRWPNSFNYGNPKPDAELPDQHGRPPEHRHHGHPLPNSQLNDDRGRWPGHPHYGNPKSDAELAAEAAAAAPKKDVS